MSFRLWRTCSQCWSVYVHQALLRLTDINIYVDVGRQSVKSVSFFVKNSMSYFHQHCKHKHSKRKKNKPNRTVCIILKNKIYWLQVNRESLLRKIEAFSYQTESFYKWYSQWIYKTETKIKVVIPVIIFIDTESKIFASTCSLAFN